MPKLAHQFHQIAGKHIQNCKLACERMVSGVEYLKKNEQAFLLLGSQIMQCFYSKAEVY